MDLKEMDLKERESHLKERELGMLITTIRTLSEAIDSLTRAGKVGAVDNATKKLIETVEKINL